MAMVRLVMICRQISNLPERSGVVALIVAVVVWALIVAVVVVVLLVNLAETIITTMCYEQL